VENRGMIISVQFQAEGAKGDWNVELLDPRSDKPVGKLPERALDDAVFQANEMKNAHPLYELRDYRAMRAQMIERHFLQCARKLIDQIEDGEGWDEWLSRLK